MTDLKKVVIATSDATSSLLVDPGTLSTTSGLPVTFVNQHKGNNIPAELRVHFPTGVSVETQDGKSLSDGLLLKGNGMETVVLKKSAELKVASERYSVTVHWSGSGIQDQVSAPDLVIDDD